VLKKISPVISRNLQANPGVLENIIGNNRRSAFCGVTPIPWKAHTRRRDRTLHDARKFNPRGLALAGPLPASVDVFHWIVKLPAAKFKHVPENEFAMMELARQIGIQVPETRLINIHDIKGLPKGMEILGDTAFLAKRFDRKDNGGAVHMEDFAQVFDVFPEQKYKNASYGDIARILWIETGEQGVAEFVRRLIFNALIGNADMHLKNWSLVYPNRRAAALSPAYDFVSTIAYLPDDKMALTLARSKLFESLTLEQLKRFAGKAGLPEKLTTDTAATTIEAFRKAWKDSGDLAIDDFVRDRIDAHLGKIPIWKI
jgi:serine/threonine-protein kinase HipA